MIPIFICVVLPVAIVLIVAFTKMDDSKNRTKVLLKAIENNCISQPEKFAEIFWKPRKSMTDVLNNRLLCGCIFTLVGIAVTVYCLFIEELILDHIDGDLLLMGLASLAVGISFLIVYFVTRKNISDSHN